MGACFKQDRALDSRSKGLGFDSTAGHVKTCRANFSFHSASAYPVVMSTW